MSYYTTVLVKCDDTAFERIKNVYDKYEKQQPSVVNRDGEMWVLCWEKSNHWDEYCCDVKKILYELVNENKSLIKFIRIGDTIYDWFEYATDYGIQLNVNLVYGDLPDDFNGTILRSY